MESEKTQRARLLKELTDKVSYWADRNEDYMEAYLTLLHAFSMPNIKERNEDENTEDA